MPVSITAGAACALVGVWAVIVGRRRPRRGSPTAAEVSGAEAGFGISRGALAAITALAALTVLAGWRSFVEERRLRSAKASIADFYYTRVRVMGEVVSEAKRTSSGLRFAVRSSSLSSEGGFDRSGVRLMVTSSGMGAPPLGATIVVSGVLAPPRPSLAAYYERSHVVAVLRAGFVEIRAPPNRMLQMSEWVRARLSRAVSASLPRREGALMLGLLIGDDDDLDPSTREAFRYAGMSHLTAVSGQNFAVVLAMAAFGIDALRRRRIGEESSRHNWPRTVALVAVGLFFGLLTRWEPSVLRAGAMAVLGLCLTTAGARIRPLEVLSLSMAALFVIDPFLADSAGFQLSAAATAGILVSGRAWAKSWAQATRGTLGRGTLAPLGARAAEGLSTLAAVCAAAQVYVTPVLFWRFGTLQPAGVVSNLLAVPIAEIASLIGFAAAIPGMFAPVVARYLLEVSGPALSLLIRTAEGFSDFPPFEVTMSETVRGIIAAVVCCSVALLARASRRWLCPRFPHEKAERLWMR